MDLKFLKKYIKTPSPSGYEVALGGQKVWTDYVKKVNPNLKITLDSYGNASAKLTSAVNSGGLNVVLDAHVDEIAFLVRDITSQGYLKVSTLGGSDISITPSGRANIWRFGNTKTPIRGVFGHPAIHIHRRDFKADPDNIFIDIGASSKKEVIKQGIEIGNPITMDGKLEILGDYYVGRALDDKIGGYITSQVLKKLHKKSKPLSFDLTTINAVQEEVGLYGAQMATVLSSSKIDIAIAIDVTHCTNSPAYNVNRDGSVSSGKGPVIMTAPSLHNTLTDFMVKVAKDSKIDIQRTTSGRSSGTNADSYAYVGGIPTALLKLPLKYMHTTVEMVHRDDVEDTINLLYKTLTSLKFSSLDLEGNKLISNN